MYVKLSINLTKPWIIFFQSALISTIQTHLKKYIFYSRCVDLVQKQLHCDPGKVIGTAALLSWQFFFGTSALSSWQSLWNRHNVTGTTALSPWQDHWNSRILSSWQGHWNSSRHCVLYKVIIELMTMFFRTDARSLEQVHWALDKNIGTVAYIELFTRSFEH